MSTTATPPRRPRDELARITGLVVANVSRRDDVGLTRIKAGPFHAEIIRQVIERYEVEESSKK